MTFKKNGRIWFQMVLITIALIPIIITVFEVIFAKDNSITFLGKYSPGVTFVLISYYILLLGFGIYWFIKQLIFIAQIKNEKTKAELMLLRSQVNPHFFFNMLNNIYGWIAKDTKKAQDLVLKLSDMMRYSIYEGEKEMVTLKAEIDYLRNYIELHKMRYQKQIAIDFRCKVEENDKVTPLLFIILLENAFKHGVENLRENAFVNVTISSIENNIQFTVENNFDKSEHSKNIPGIGLKNLKRRLELTYPNNHRISFSITEDVYKAQITLRPL